MNISMRWKKVRGDMQLYRVQLIAIALVLMLGAAGVTAALNAHAVLRREIAASFASASAADISLWVDRVEPPMIAAIAAEAGVAAVEARRSVYTRVAGNNGTWLLVRITIIPDFAHQKMDFLHLHEGVWPASEEGLFIEQSGQTLIDARPAILGDAEAPPLRLRTPNGDIVSIPFTAFVHGPGIAPSTQERSLDAYVTPKTAAMLGQGLGQTAPFNQLLVKMRQRNSTTEAAALGNALQATLTKLGTPAPRMEVLAASHPHHVLMDAMLNVLKVLAVMAFICSAAMASYMVSACMRREVRVIGIMKTMGATGYQITVQYLSLLGPIVLLAVALGLPLGIVLGRAVIQYYGVILNIDITDWRAPGALLIHEMGLAVCIPLLAMAVPTLRAVQMTAHAAIHDAGIVKPGLAGRFAARFVKVPNQIGLTLAMRNTWRRPWRLMIMLIGLSAGGGLLLMTHNNMESFMQVIDTSLLNQGHDIEVRLKRPLPASELEKIARAVPDVNIAEAWRRAGVNLITPNSSSASSTATDANAKNNTNRATLVGYPPETQLFKLPVVNGRLPSADAANEVLVTRALLEVFPKLQVGTTLEIQSGLRQVSVKVMGLVEEIATPNLYTNFATFEAVTGMGDAAEIIRVKVNGNQLEPVVSGLDQAFLNGQHPPSAVISRAVVRDGLEEHFKVVSDVVRMVALAAALIGGIMLAATTILNISERTREIGILRTLGATPRNIGLLFLAEGVWVTLVSFGLAVLISIALTLTILNVAEHQVLHVAAPLHFSLKGLAILCSGAIVVLLAVLLAVAYAARKTIREAIAYE